MKVRSLIGSLAGQTIDMEFADAVRCITAGTHEPGELGGKDLPVTWRTLPLRELNIIAGAGGGRSDHKTKVDAIAEIDDLIRRPLAQAAAE